MTIKINQKNIKVDPPRITLYGQKITAPYHNQKGAYDTDTISTLEEVIGVEQHGLTTVRKRESLLYRSDVDITFVLDKTYTLQTYGASRYATRSGNRFIGAMQPGITGNTHAEIYYTLNGKDPVRTKANLYTGIFTVKRNESGSANTILKARTYCQGKASKVIKVEFRIIRPDENLV